MGPLLISANSFWNIANFRGQLVEALVRAGYPVWIAAPHVDLAWARAQGVEAIDIAIDRSGLNPVRDGVLWLDYLRLFRRTKPAFYLGFTAKPNIYGSLAAQLLGVASLPNVSGLGTAFMSDGPLARFVSLLYRIAFRRCPIVFFQNSDDRDLFVARKIVRSGQARILPGSGIDLAHFAPAPMPADIDAPAFLFIGRLLGDKGVREFAEAARRIRAEKPGWRFQLLGDIDYGNRTGIGADELRQWVADGLIEHLGYSEDIRPHIAGASAIVLPSYREGLPRSLLEGAAMARPLIASDVPGNRQLVQHDVNGLLCEARDSGSLADAMLRFGSIALDRRVQMGLAGRALVEREYGVERVVTAYLDALTQLANEPGVRDN
jgi:glycosyltransferase involved in cell wall biosynthesis